MNVEVIIVLVALVGMLAALIMDKMRPGMILFSVVVLFLCTGILSPKEMLEGFSNKGMITVAMLFLVSEGIRQSGALTQVIKKLLPQEKTSVFKAQIHMLPSIAFISAFLNNTPIVVIFAPIIKRWASSVKLPATYFLIPLSYVTILGGICTLIGTSTNLGNEEEEQNSTLHLVEAVIGPRFPGINKRVGDFNFKRHYGAEIKELRRSGHTYTDLGNIRFREGDTLVVLADDSFIRTWGESSVFLMLANGKDYEPAGKKKRWFALILLLIMIIGATIGELPAIQRLLPEGIKLDMFFFVSITTVIMAWTKIFPPQKYTKYISWDILITIACAFAISKAMENSGVADLLASYIIGLSHSHGPYVLLAAMFIITNIFTELITNNAAAALSFPLALSISQQLGVSPMPFFVVICMAASASFSTPIGYQTNLIVQGIGNYKFTDFVRIGLPLNIITFLISVFVIPQIWSF